jgi:hypothetical protein
MHMPINLAYDEAKQRLIDTITHIYGELQVPYFLLEMLLKDLHAEAYNAAQQEKQMAKSQYDKALAAEAEKITQDEE